MAKNNITAVTRVLEASRRKLLDTGTRNRLIHINRTNQRANCLNVINERGDEIYSILRIQAKRMRFKAMGKDKTSEDEEMHLASPEVDLPEGSNRLTDSFIETPLGPEALARRLLRLAGNAKTAEEEQGVNILYLAIGMLRWRESASSEIQREAPLILLPVQLLRNDRTSTYDILCRDDDITTNLPLSERLRQDFGISLPEVDEVEGWKPSSYFELVSDAVSGQPGWSVDVDGMQLGFFSFAKLLMHRDLDPSSWPDGAFIDNPLLKGLLTDGFPEDVPLFGPTDKLDEKLDPAEIIQVIDADASQTKVIEEVRRGSSLVVQGPPGTGKSQTITNIIAAAAHDGKTVLFVAEKMAALSVVHDRLVKSGLRDICLELHSRSANKKALAQELGRTLAASAKALKGTADPAQLRKTRDELNRISDLLHEPLTPLGDTPYRALSQIVGLLGKGAPPPSISLDGLEELDEPARNRSDIAIASFVSALASAGPPEAHPFRGTKALDLQPTDLTRLESELNDALSEIISLTAELSRVAEALEKPVPKSLVEVPALCNWVSMLVSMPAGAAPLVPLLFENADAPNLESALAAGVEWADAQEKASKRFSASAWDAAVDSLHADIAEGLTPLLSRLPFEIFESHGKVVAAIEEIEVLVTEASRIAQIFLQPRPETIEDIDRLCAALEHLALVPDGGITLTPVLFEASSQTRLLEGLESGVEWAAAYKSAASHFSDAAWTAELTKIRPAILRGQRSLLSRVFGGYRRASSELATLLSGALPTAPSDRMALVNELLNVQAKRKRLSEDEEWLRTILGPEWRGERTQFSEIKKVAIWLSGLRSFGRYSSAAQLVGALKETSDSRGLALGLAARASSCLSRVVELISLLQVDFVSEGQNPNVGSSRLVELKSTLVKVQKYYSASEKLASLLVDSLPNSTRERLILVDEIVEVQSLRKRLSECDDFFRDVLGDEWRGLKTKFSEIQSAVQWFKMLKSAQAFSSATRLSNVLLVLPDPAGLVLTIRERAESCFSVISAPIVRLKLDLSQAGLTDPLEETPLAEIKATYLNMNTDLSCYGTWAALTRSMDDVAINGAGVILKAISERKLDPARAGQEFTYACAEARWNNARKLRPELNVLPQLNRHELVNLFHELEKDRIENTKTLVLSRHFEQMPRGTMGEMGVIRGEIGRKRGHKPIRWVMKNAGGMVQRIKPVMLMSPISVAQFLPSDSVTFDLLVIDEASQIRPEDALGVVARAKQIVVVGDQKQLPPTSFFDRLIDDVEEVEDDDDDGPVGASAADMESILSLCEARGLRQRMLEWHYRSRDPSLIRVSNTEFYNDGLVLPPSPLQLDPDYGLKFLRVPGVYARGGSGLGRPGTNRIEAEYVAGAVAEHARSWPDLSLGIVTFSKAQADMLTEVLEMQRRRDPILDSFLREGKSEDVFIKNIENVQGDERDVILISVGYGPQEPNGRLAAMSFGPVNGEGGERRLNVLFSRARVRCEVFASFDPADIDPTRVKRDGPRVLKRFLDYAKTGVIEESVPTGLDADSPFEEDVANVIQSLGYIADPQVGTAGFRVDIGVRHPERPGQYLVAVECDGSAYHSALWARERDRLRQGILENLGWVFHRIWSTDWFYNRKGEVERLRRALEAAKSLAETGIRVQGSNSGIRAAAVLQIPDDGGDALDIQHLALKAPAYLRANFSVKASLQPHEAPLNFLNEIVTKIVAIEGPIHEDEVARRVTTVFGLSRAGGRIVEATNRAIRSVCGAGKPLRKQGPFVLTEAHLENPPVRDRSDETGSLLKAEYLAPIEISAAAKQIVKESGEMLTEDLTRAVARLLGFQRVGPDLYEAITKVLTRP